MKNIFMLLALVFGMLSTGCAHYGYVRHVNEDVMYGHSTPAQDLLAKYPDDEILGITRVDGGYVVRHRRKSAIGTSRPQSVKPRIKSQKNLLIFCRPVPGWLTKGLHGHNAVDFHVDKNTLVRASAAGVVTKTCWDNNGGGNTIFISHGNGIYTVYCHLSTFYVKMGDPVQSGQVIASPGATGNASAPHLHYEEIGTGKDNSFAKDWS